ncbi:MAG: tRNA preQ1(34) S-adenosylmethionine ribosyltransferase-isomerase QueA [Hyphomicrobiaceae bacterium]
MRTDLFDFDLPDDRIALRPTEPRDRARMLVVRQPGRSQGQGWAAPAVLEDRSVHDLPSLLAPGDALVVNDTKVIPAALDGTRERNGHIAHVAFNLIKRIDESHWRAFARPAKRLEVGDRVVFQAEGRVCLAGSLSAVVAQKLEGGEVELAFSLHSAFLDEAIEALGDMPLPPYIALKRPPDDADRASYQTMFAAREGAVAAPTAALHFTPRLSAALAGNGIARHTLTLHVGAGTFLPVKADDTDQHAMHAEWGEIGEETAAALNGVRARGGRIVAVGTTALRLLESAVDASGRIRPFRGETSIFITPGYRFRAVDVLMTNFHLPRSTLFMLVSAFAGLDTMHAAYRHAIREFYRFYSYGDASLLFRGD